MSGRLGIALVAFGAVLARAPSIAAQDNSDQLRLATVVHITSEPLFTTDGRPDRGAADRITSLADSLSALQRSELADIPLALAPSPVFCDELARFGGAVAARLIRLLHDLGSRLPVLSAPYAEVQLPHLSTPAAVEREIRAGREVLEDCVRARPIDVVFPPDLVLGRDALLGALAAGTPATLAAADGLPRGISRSEDVTLIPSQSVRAGATPNDALVPLEAEDVAALVLEPLRPDLGTFLTALANDPRVVLQPLEDVLTDPTSRLVEFPSVATPPASYTTAVAQAQDALHSFRSYILPDNRLASILATGVGRARSTAEWNGHWDTGARRARALTAIVDRQRRVVSAPNGSVTFTSRRGSVPVTVTNGATYPVRLRITLESSKLTFPEGSGRVVTVDPPGDTTVFAAFARSTGTFPVQVRVSSPDGDIVFHSGELTVRSTAANLPALILTAGGAVFLVGWSARQIRRRRRERGDK